MLQTGSPVGDLSVGLYPTGRAHDVQSGLCEAKRSLKRSRVEHSLRKGLEESEKDGQKRRLNHVNGTRNLTRCSWVCWSCEKKPRWLLHDGYARPGPRARVWQVESCDGDVGETQL